MAMMKEAKWKVTESGGNMIEVNLANAKNNTGTGYKTGFEPLNIAPQTGSTAAFFPWTYRSWSLSIGGPEQFKNSGSAKMVDVISMKEKQLVESASEEMNAFFLDATNTSAATAEGNTAPQSLAYFMRKLPTSGTIGLINTAVETKWRNQYQDGSGWDTIDEFKTGMNAFLRKVNLGVGKGCDTVLFDPVSYGLLEASMQGQIRYSSTKMAELGFGNLALSQGVSAFYDCYVPDMNAGTNGGPDTTLSAGTAFFLNSNHIKYYVGKGFDFKPLPMERLGPQDSKTSLTLLYCQLVPDNLRKLGVVYGLPTAFTA